MSVLVKGLAGGYTISVGGKIVFITNEELKDVISHMRLVELWGKKHPDFAHSRHVNVSNYRLFTTKNDELILKSGFETKKVPFTVEDAARFADECVIEITNPLNAWKTDSKRNKSGKSNDSGSLRKSYKKKVKRYCKYCGEELVAPPAPQVRLHPECKKIKQRESRIRYNKRRREANLARKNADNDKTS